MGHRAVEQFDTCSASGWSGIYINNNTDSKDNGIQTSSVDSSVDKIEEE